MKLNNLSRLTALLLALTMILPIFAAAEDSVGFGDLTLDTLNTYYSVTEFTEAGYCSVCAGELVQEEITIWPVSGYACLHTYLGDMATTDAYQLLYDLDRGTSEEYTLGQVYINAHAAHVTTATADLKRDAVICYSYDCTKNPLIAPGPSHIEGTCPWWQAEEYVPDTETSLAEQFKALTAIEDKTLEQVRQEFVDALTDEKVAELLAGLDWVAGSGLTNNSVAVNGALPGIDNTVLPGVTMSAAALSSTITEEILLAFLGADGINFTDTEDGSGTTLPIFGYDINLYFYGKQIEPNGALNITFPNAWLTTWALDDVDFFAVHILNSAESIQKETTAGNTVYYTNDAALLAAYPSTSAEYAAAAAAGKEGYIAYTVSTYPGNVTLNDDGSATHTVYSLSDDYGIALAEQTFEDTAENFYNNTSKSMYFYWRLENETTHTDENDCSVVTVTYTNAATTNTNVPHFAYAANLDTGLTCQTVMNYPAVTSDGTFTLNVKTEPGYVVTSYRIGCEFVRDGTEEQKGEGCQTVESQNLTVAPDETGNFYSDFPIEGTGKTFGHSSNNNSSRVNYVLILTVEKVSMDIEVEKTVNKTTTTKGDVLTYQIKATNTSSNQITYTAAQIEDTFLAKGVTITSITSDDSGTTFGTPTFNYSYYSNGAPGSEAAKGSQDISLSSSTTLPTMHNNQYSIFDQYISIPCNGDGWEYGETITITYTYTVTDDDVTTGSLQNTAFVYGMNSQGQVEDTGVAFVKVIVNEPTQGSIQIFKEFTGEITSDEIQKLLYADDTTKRLTFTVVDESGASYTVDGPHTSTVTVTNENGTQSSKTVYFWNVTGLDPSKTYTITEDNCEVEGYTWTSSADSQQVTVTAGNTTTVTFTNTYTAQPKTGDLVITKTVTAADGVTLPDDTFTFTVTLTGVTDYTGITYTSADGVTTNFTSDTTITLKNGQSATIIGIPADTVYEVTEAEMASYDTAVTGESGTILAGESATAAFTNTYNPGSLTITKTVEGVDADDLTDKTFSFVVTGVNDPIVLSASNNWTHTISNLPVGEYSITEKTTDISDYILTSVKVGDTVLTATNDIYTTTVEVAKGKTTSVAFTNVYTKKVGSLTIIKMVEGDGAPEGDVFTFNVELSDKEFTYTTTAGVSITQGSGTVTITDAGSVIIPGIKVGTTYTVTESTPPAYYTSSAVVYNPDPDGNAVIVETGNTATVTNTYNTGSLIIEKKVEGDNAPDDTFTMNVTLTLPNDLTALPGSVKQEVSTGVTAGSVSVVNGVATQTFTGVQHNGKITISGLPVGTKYAVEESVKPAYYETTGEVKAVEEETIVIGTNSVQIVNKFLSGSLIISKTVDGVDKDDIPTGKVFSFQVTDAANNLVSTVTLAHGENCTLDNLPIGTYTVTEISTNGVPAIIDDYTFQGVKINDADIQTTGFVATVEVVKNAETTVAYTNVYTKNTTSLTVQKRVEGTGAPENDEFTIKVTFTGKAGSSYALPKTYKLNDGTSQELTLTDGAATFIVKAGATITFPDVVIDTTYEVAEITKPDYYTVEYTGQTGTLTKDGAAAVVTNTYLTGDLEITKVVDGTGMPESDTFEIQVAFTLPLVGNAALPTQYKLNSETTLRDIYWTGNVATFASIVKGDKITITGIPYGVTYVVTETSKPGYYSNQVIYTYSDNTNKRIDSEKDTVEVKNTYLTGSLTVTKNVEGVTTDVYPSNFEFTLALTDAAGKPVNATLSSETTGITLNKSDNGYTFTLTDGDSVTIKGIPVGVTYTVTETPIPDYFTTAATGENATENVVCGTVEANATDTAVFTNTAKTSTLTVVKEGMSSTNESAIVEVTVAGKTYTVVLNNNNGWDAVIANLPIGVAYSADETKWSWRYDATKPTISYSDGENPTINKDGSSTITITNTPEEDKWLHDEDFKKNTFAPNN